LAIDLQLEKQNDNYTMPLPFYLATIVDHAASFSA
jgi:hypothetical protein